MLESYARISLTTRAGSTPVNLASNVWVIDSGAGHMQVLKFSNDGWPSKLAFLPDGSCLLADGFS